MSEKVDSVEPEIRFGGFGRPWQMTKLGELGTFKNGMNFGKEAMGHGHLFVNLQNVFGRTEVDSQKLEYAESSEQQRRDYNLVKGDVLFIRSSVKPEGVGETALINETPIDTTYSGFIIRFRPDVKMADEFNRTVYRTTGIRKQIMANASRSANTNINQDALHKITFNLPCFKEQTKIGSYFKSLDRMIELHQRKHDKLVILKQAMLQKMFPQVGASTPEIRFKGFEGGWETKLLEQLAMFSKGQGYSKKDLIKSGTPIILYGRLYTAYQTEIADVNTFVCERRGAVKSNGSEVVIPSSGETAEDIARASAVIQKGVILGGDLNIVTPTEKLDSCFLALSLSNGELQQKLARKAQGKSVVHVRNSDLEDLDIPVPDFVEQQKIGKYFRNLDKLISKHATQLKKLKNIKSACLDKMFV